MSVRASPISRTAAILIVVIGAFVLVAGLATGSLPNIIGGVAFVALGIVLLLLLRWFTRKVSRELGEEDRP